MSKILLVEDDELIVRLYEKLFKLEGFEIAVANNGQAGLDKLKEDKPDIILLDVMMPQMNGLEMLGKLKEDENIKDIPVVVLTNVADVSIANEAISRGAVLSLVKSESEPEDVVAAVNGVLERSKQ
jgi:CheY-like chemotaxis protein